MPPRVRGQHDCVGLGLPVPGELADGVMPKRTQPAVFKIHTDLVEQLSTIFFFIILGDFVDSDANLQDVKKDGDTDCPPVFVEEFFHGGTRC